MLRLSVPLARILITLVAKLSSHQITGTQLKITFHANYINQHKHLGISYCITFWVSENNDNIIFTTNAVHVYSVSHTNNATYYTVHI
jgi:hypothetical protein